MRSVLQCSGLLAAAVLARGACAELAITGEGGAPLNPDYVTKVYNPLTAGWDVQLHALYNPSGDTIYEVRGTGGEIIDNLIIDVPCWLGPDGECMPAGSPLTVRVMSAGGQGLRSVRSIVQTGDAETILALVDVTEDVGAIEVEAIGVVEAGRDVLGPVIATTVGNPDRGISSITAQGDIRGDILAPHGRIGLVVAYGGAGTAAAPVRIEARDELLHVVVVGDCFAHINSRVNGGAGKIYRVRTTRFHGTIETRALRSNPFNGKMPRIWAFDEFVGTITIGGSLANPAHLIELPPFGLQGQIIVNADADPAGTWSAPVRLGPEGSPQQIVLDGPGYTIPAGTLGGGSVGLVPFGLHDESCDPPNHAGAPAEDLVVRLRHYGPVRMTGGQPLLIQRRAAGSTDPFVAIPTSGFAISPAPDDPNSIDVRAATGWSGFQSGFEYRLQPTAQLVSDVAAAPPVSWAEPYQVVVESAFCPGDLDGSGAVGLLDLKIVLGAWGPVGAGNPADLDGDGVVGIFDLLALLGLWGPCP